MHNILEGSDHNKTCPLQQQEFSNDKKFRNGLKFCRSKSKQSTGATKAATPNSKAQT